MEGWRKSSTSFPGLSGGVNRAKAFDKIEEM